MKKTGFILVSLIVIIAIIIALLFFQNKNIENSSWKITSWGNNEAGQEMSFTIEGDKKGLIIVDGGYRTSQEDIRSYRIKNK